MNPLKPFHRINRIKPAPGQEEIAVDAIFRFSTEALRQAFLAYLGEAELPEPVVGVVIWTAPPETYDSAGEPGMIAQDGAFLYVYAGNGTTIHQWPRIPLGHSWT